MTKQRRKRSILRDSNAIWYYLAKEDVKAAHVARVNGISRASITNKMVRDLDSMTLKSYLQIAKGVGKPVGVVIEEILAIDKELKATYGLNEIEETYQKHQESHQGRQLVIDRNSPANHVKGRRMAERA